MQLNQTKTFDPLELNLTYWIIQSILLAFHENQGFVYNSKKKRASSFLINN